ncbi:hypothetical protein DERP_000610, partial [Dermatophagoides pteronyssinus]
LLTIFRRQCSLTGRFCIGGVANDIITFQTLELLPCKRIVQLNLILLDTMNMMEILLYQYNVYNHLDPVQFDDKYYVYIILVINKIRSKFLFKFDSKSVINGQSSYCGICTKNCPVSISIDISNCSDGIHGCMNDICSTAEFQYSILSMAYYYYHLIIAARFSAFEIGSGGTKRSRIMFGRRE